MARTTGKSTTDHDEIRRWAEERGGTPAHVRRTGSDADVGILRIDFPGYADGDTLEEISWDDWFDKFDERALALIYQENTAAGQKSNFNKLVSRKTIDSGNTSSKSRRQPAKSSRARTARATNAKAASKRSARTTSKKRGRVAQMSGAGTRAKKSTAVRGKNSRTRRAA